ncbi:hemolysin family protein [Nocardioides sp. TRM66260-LWL]|uniref:hemolysin family protein n=1 Tax=Nocardioides sp. TRM66260-LWL TaxID=2874478 RepID=UPI001CC5F13A|nr:hemolysin family protein [Nocardioides sp. TRM66260-LWL]MBZ5735816.1 hemolysin family protein [Nocardioides sp. TRM66260-LWL]
MDLQTLVNLGLVVLFVLVGGVFAATEIALVSLRESQLAGLARSGARGAKVAEVARDPNRFLAAVQIGVTVAGFFSAAYGGSTLAPDLAPSLTRLGLGDDAAQTVALVAMTLLIAYLSLVLGELVPKRLALQRSAGLAVVVTPALDRFARLMRPVIWLLSLSTDALVRLLGGDPDATGEELSEEELRDLVTTHEGLDDQERRILGDVLGATRTTVREVMRPRGDVAFLDADLPLADAVARVRDLPYSRYPVTGRSVDDVVGFLHVRDLIDLPAGGSTTVRDVVRTILLVPNTALVLPTVTTMREAGTHLAVVVDEYGGTDGIVTLEDLVEELVGEIADEYDPDPAMAPARLDEVDAALSIEDFAELTGVVLPDGDYDTAAGYVLARLQRIPTVGDEVEVLLADDLDPDDGEDGSVRVHLRVIAMAGPRILRLQVRR